MTQTQGVAMKVAVADPLSPTHVVKPNADGSINANVIGSGGSGLALEATLQDVLTQDELTNTLLSTPATYLPLPGMAAKGDTTLLEVIKNISSATTTQIVAGTSAQTIRCERLVLECTGANVITFKSATTAIWFDITFGSGGGSLTLDVSGYPWMVTAAAEDWNVTTTTSAATGLKGWYQKS